MYAKPTEVFEHGVFELWSAALRIEIFVSEDQSAMMLARALGGDPERAGVSQMKQARRRRCHAASILVGRHNSILTSWVAPEPPL
jgi:hypothetical protein